MKKCILVFAVILSVFASGCVQQQVHTLPSVVLIKDTSFNPSTVTVKAGATVIWINEDPFTHDVTMDNGLFDHDIEANKSFLFTFNDTGTYTYHCDIHPSMNGKIIVE